MGRRAGTREASEQVVSHIIRSYSRLWTECRKFLQRSLCRTLVRRFTLINPISRTNSVLGTVTSKGKAKVNPIICHDGTALGGGGWLTPHPGRFTPGMTRYPLYRRLGGPQGPSKRVRKMSPPPGFDLRTVQPVASRYLVPHIFMWSNQNYDDKWTGNV